MAGLPLHPKHPERVCWGCDRFCPAHDLACGNGTIRTPHPQELYGADWVEWAQENGIAIGGPDVSEHVTEESRATPAEKECEPYVAGQVCRGRSSSGEDVP
jgi:hypothetical protein